MRLRSRSDDMSAAYRDTESFYTHRNFALDVTMLLIMRNALISGAGIAGSTAAYWLAKVGFEVTVVELAGEMRSSGSPVDVRGAAVEVAERMGVMARIREADTDVRDMVVVNSRGRVLSRVNMRNTWPTPATWSSPAASSRRSCVTRSPMKWSLSWAMR